MTGSQISSPRPRRHPSDGEERVMVCVSSPAALSPQSVPVITLAVASSLGTEWRRCSYVNKCALPN